MEKILKFFMKNFILFLNSNVNTIITDMNNIVSSFDYDSINNIAR